ncbi:RNA-binding region-containing protein 3 isoform X2 [Protopterus annectens]|uniref:RNA-binding region-containing protein 3 isoform X2 n=1 Tax=Protopterus annectens TaxID=7888 RepID=UPI001CF94CC5|nr:RNA-binding region-containing protein 3 isoform X2 [Protopterus annectens]
MMDFMDVREKEDALIKKSSTILIRHLPSELTYDEKEELLKYVGAVSVRLFSDKGRLKHTAFATFENEDAAAKALCRLHQLHILGCTLKAEFARRPEDRVPLSDCPSTSDKRCLAAKEKEGEKEAKETCVPLIENGIAPSHRLTFPMNPRLKYHYPPPTNMILTNIANALAGVPKFYVQVLHLMNKMNLPAPFGLVTACPPVFVPEPPPPIPPMPPEHPPLPLEEEEMEVSSEAESEYESGDEEEKERVARIMEMANLPAKLPLSKKQPRKRKRPKIKDLLTVPKPPSQSSTHTVLTPSDVFEQPQPQGPRKIEFHIPADVPVLLERQEDGKNVLHFMFKADKTIPEPNECSGFGKIYPTPISDDKCIEEEEDDLPSEFISRRELEKGKISKQEMESSSLFKNYEAGDPTCRLYVKNVAKQTQEKDLKFIFGRYVDFSSETEKNMFDIRLMKEGRMKGQAFIGLPNEKAAAKAVKEVNGYVLHERPMVVQFARSARPKSDSSETKKRK